MFRNVVVDENKRRITISVDVTLEDGQLASLLIDELGPPLDWWEKYRDKQVF